MGKAGIHALVAAYQRDGKGLAEIYENISALVYGDPEYFGFDSPDDAAEALLRYRRRIKSLADRYADSGSPFEAYLAASLRYLAKTMRRNRKRRRERELVCERSESWSAELHDQASFPPAVFGEGAEARMRQLLPCRSFCESLALKNRLIYLYLKCAWDSDDSKTLRIAEMTGVSADWLAAATAQSLRFLEAERCRYERLSSRRDRTWGRLCLLEGRLREELDPLARQSINDAVSREKGKLDRVRAEIRAFKPIVPNAVVARVLGVPKGTVDSGLYYLKKRSAAFSGL